MGDSALVLTSFGFLVVCSILLAMAGFGTASVRYPTNVPTSAGNSSSTTSQSDVIECVVAGFFLGIIGVSAICDEGAVGIIVTTFTNGLIFAFVAFTFLFQLITFQIPEIPAWLNAIIVVPPGITLVFVGFKTIRGVGD